MRVAFSPFRSRFSRTVVGVLAGVVATAALAAQTTLAISGASYSGTGSATTFFYQPLLNAAGTGYFADPAGDQQTGHYEDDFVGRSASDPGFLIRSGTINGVESIAFRFRLNEYDPKHYDNNARLGIGIDANADGVADLYFGADFSNKGVTLVFQSPGTGSNTSPSTSTLGKPFGPQFEAGELSLPTSLLTLQEGVTWSYIQVTETNTPGFTAFASARGNIDPDAYVTFAVPFLFLKEAMEDLTGLTLTTDSFVRFVAFTSTQTNVVNQDVFGSGWSGPTDFHGNPIPEPATYVQLGLLLLVGVGAYHWR
ncbi:MAG TPA: hypothetical protein VHF69_02020, partial [Candidatus Synoicihabitans sp.]|nr:hypothetical protein [Candidatus Synoicihabitans sp.]